MKLNKFVWNNYIQTKEAKDVIEIFKNGEIPEISGRYIRNIDLNEEQVTNFIFNLIDFTTSPIIDSLETYDEARLFLENIYDNGVELTFEDDLREIPLLKDDFTHYIGIVSTWLFYKFPKIFKPYYFKNDFDLLVKIADTFGIELPEVPLKRHKKERFIYYLELCKCFNEFQLENNLTDFEFCAFLNDFALEYIDDNDETDELPEPTQVWWIGGDKYGADFEFLDENIGNKTISSFWQGNIDTRKGDILVVYCLSPRSYIHSVWRATKDGIADPFFHYYSNIYIGHGTKVPPITIHELKEDKYFSKNPLVRKNLQGINGYPLSSEDYQYLQKMLSEKGLDCKILPQLYKYIYEQNKELKNEREVEVNLIEPFLKNIGFQEKDWIRQLTVRMGRGERNFPDYAFLIDGTKGFEKAHMLIESKFYIKNNKELEETFKQVWSYGQRLSANILIIADKDSIWIYKQHNNSFDRTKYRKYFWKELENPDKYNEAKKLIGK
ncbi:restriction endonuclease subunit R [Soonwooa sp.]|uniref:restriction endonuclease subunit R n=1 Tax=Soonwooa sp. TaxID=1938592 RepID=UPI0028966FF4|nr:restriction endonuclease subunit R [Soonwooa sp.]